MSNLPVYDNAGTLTPLELFFRNSMTWLTNRITLLFLGTRLEYWLLDPNGQAYTLFLTTLAGVSIWLLYFNQQFKAIAAVDLAYYRSRDDVLAEGDVYSEQDDDGSLLSSPGTSPFTREEKNITRNLAAPGHRPATVLPIYMLRAHHSTLEALMDLALVTPQRPAVKRLLHSIPDLLKHSRLGLLQRVNDTGLIENTMVSHQSTQGHASGTPTEKRENEQRATEGLGFEKKTREEDKPLFAQWSNEVERAQVGMVKRR